MNDKAVIAALNALKDEIVAQTVAVQVSLDRIEVKMAEAQALLARVKFSEGGSVVVKIDQQ